MKLEKLPTRKVTINNILTASAVAECIQEVQKAGPRIRGIVCLMDMGNGTIESIRNIDDASAIHLMEYWKIQRMIGDNNE